MAGVALAQGSAVGTGLGVPEMVAQVPADESWLVYRCVFTELTGVGGINITIYRYDSNNANWVGIATNQTVANGNGSVDSGAFVLNANDQIGVYTQGNPVDFFASGLIQRGPGQVPG